MKQHISKQFDQELNEIKSRVLVMGGLVERQLNDALKTVFSGDVVEAERVVLNDDKVNELEVLIDEECLQVLARRQPAAVDLRLVIEVIKTIADLERIGDEAKRIARQTSRMSEHYSKKNQLLDLEHMGKLAAEMLHDALDAFARTDIEHALTVVKGDSLVDLEYERIVRQQMTYMVEDPRTIPAAIDIMWAARALERIADRSCNVCEYMIYQVKGRNLRHASLEELEASVLGGRPETD